MQTLRKSLVSMVMMAAVLGVIGFDIAARADHHEAEEAASQSAQKAVLVTGASSGIGLKITEVLADRGVYVYAGARKAEDLKLATAPAEQ